MVRIARGFVRGDIPLEQIKSRPEIEPEADRNLLGEAVRFALVGIASTVLFALLFLLFRTVLEPVMANIAALLLATIANTAINRRFTFGLRSRAGAVRHQLQGFVVLAIALAITSGSLIVLHTVSPDTSRSLELLVLTGANLLATVVRFLLMRSWIFNRKANVS
jgi:putative flippase GtrA